MQNTDCLYRNYNHKPLVPRSKKILPLKTSLTRRIQSSLILQKILISHGISCYIFSYHKDTKTEHFTALFRTFKQYSSSPPNTTSYNTYTSLSHQSYKTSHPTIHYMNNPFHTLSISSLSREKDYLLRRLHLARLYGHHLPQNSSCPHCTFTLGTPHTYMMQTSL